MDNRLSVQKPVSRKNPHYPISNLFLIVLLYIVEAKKGSKKKSLNILSLAAYLLKCFNKHTYHILSENPSSLPIILRLRFQIVVLLFYIVNFKE